MTQSDTFQVISDKVRGVLDKVAPMNPSEKQERRTYRFPISPDSRKIVRQKKDLHVEYLKSIRRKEAPEISSQKLRDYKSCRNAAKSLCREIKSNYDSDRICKSINSTKNIWELLRVLNPAKKLSRLPETLKINGKSGTDLANHMAQFYYKRARLVPDDEAEQFKEFIPFP